MNISIIRIKYKDILSAILWICLLQGFISDYFGFRQVNYLCDFLLVVLMICKLRKGNGRLLYKNRIIYIPIIAFVLVVLVGWLFNPAPIFMALWGARNYGRFFLFFVFALVMWDENDVIKIENVLLKLFPIHMSLVAYQYLIEGLRQDNLSGIFGRYSGGNGGLMIYLTVLLCIIISRYEYKKIITPIFFLYLILSFINAALSELKFFFVLAAILVVWYLLMSRRKGRGMILALFFLIALYIGIQIFYIVFPEWANYLDIDNILNLLSNQKTYATSTDIGRTAVFSRLTPIISKWAGTDALWFGIGLGNGDYSSAFSFLNSAFYEVYEFTHYTWLSLGYLFVETGYLGVIAYIGFFVILEIRATLAYQKKNTYYNLLGTFFPMVFMILLVYNSTLRSNFAYIVFTVLSWQIIMDEKMKYIKNEILEEI